MSWALTAGTAQPGALSSVFALCLCVPRGSDAVSCPCLSPCLWWDSFLSHASPPEQWVHHQPWGLRPSLHLLPTGLCHGTGSRQGVDRTPDPPPASHSPTNHVRWLLLSISSASSRRDPHRASVTTPWLLGLGLAPSREGVIASTLVFPLQQPSPCMLVYACPCAPSWGMGDARGRGHTHVHPRAT